MRLSKAEHESITGQIEHSIFERYGVWCAVIDGEAIRFGELELLVDQLNRTPAQFMLQRYLKLREEKLNREQLEQSSPGIVAWDGE